MSLNHVNNQKEFGGSMSRLFKNNEHDFWGYHLWMLFVYRESKLYQGSQCYHVNILKTYRLYSQIEGRIFGISTTPEHIFTHIILLIWSKENYYHMLDGLPLFSFYKQKLWS